jgi:hypothetical protein
VDSEAVQGGASAAGPCSLAREVPAGDGVSPFLIFVINIVIRKLAGEVPAGDWIFQQADGSQGRIPAARRRVETRGES